MDQPSSRQLEYLQFLAGFTARHGVAPSFEEVATHFMVSAPSVNNMIKTLEAKGFITRVPGAARSLRVAIPLEKQGARMPARKGAVQARTRDAGAEEPLVLLACLVVARLPRALNGSSQEILWSTFTAVADALDAQLKGMGVKDAERERALRDLVDKARNAERDWTSQPRIRKRIWVKSRG